MMARWPIGALLLVAACSRKDPPTGTDASGPTPAVATVTAVVPDAAAPEPPRERTPTELLEEHRAALGALADQGKYLEVCKGAPWFNQVVCTWVAARADGKAVDRPDGELFRAFFTKEHWKHAYGRIIGDPTASGDLEVQVNGYRNHCVLELSDTRFSSKGNFNLWVQEDPETREVTLNSGSTAQWVVLAEAPLAKSLMDLAHSGVGLEGTAMAKDAMKMIASYKTYAELKGEVPALPGAPAPPPSTAGKTAPAPSSTSAPPTPATVAARPAPAASVRSAASSPPAAPAPEPSANPRARAQCMSGCVAKCADDAACERSCASRCP